MKRKVCKKCLKSYRHQQWKRFKRRARKPWPDFIFHTDRGKRCDKCAAGANADSAKRRGAKLNATPSWADLRAIRKIYRDAKALTKATGVRHEVDHVIPLRNPLVCGLHVETNLQVIPHNENRKKRNKFSASAAEQGAGMYVVTGSGHGESHNPSP